jgi:signal transduction histidine kinase/CheY-like chemotaxis protein
VQPIAAEFSQDSSTRVDHGNAPRVDPMAAIALVPLGEPDQPARLTWASHAFFELTRMPPNQTLGQPLDCLFQLANDGCSLESVLSKLEDYCPLVVSLRERRDHDESYNMRCIRLRGPAAAGSALLLILDNDSDSVGAFSRRGPMESATSIAIGPAIIGGVSGVGEGESTGGLLGGSEGRFLAAAQASFDGLILLRALRDARGQIEDFQLTDFNHQLVALTICSETELAHRRLCDVVPRIREGCHFQRLVDVVESGSPYHELVRTQSRVLKPQWVQIQAVRLDDGLAMAVRDVSYQRSVEEQLARACHLESVGQLAAGIAHDFNNMLSVVLSFDSLVYDSLPPEAPERADLAESLAATQRAGELTRRLLAFSRMQILEPRPVDINSLLNEIRPIVTALLGKCVEVVMECAPLLPEIWIDSGQLEQAIVNLVTNARDAMPRGGTVRFETRLSDEPDPTNVSSGAHVELLVSDTGMGMNAEVCSRIFEPFFTTKAETGGTGLGLASVFGFMKQSQGRILVNSTPGQGTTFILRFPLTLPKRRSWRPSVGNFPVTDHPDQRTILLIDRDRAVRAAFRRSLEARAYTVLTATDAHDASLTVEKHVGPIHVLVADAAMCSATGTSIVKRLLSMRSNTGLVFTSGSSDHGANSELLDSLGAVLLAKPVTPESLHARVQESLALAELMRGTGGNAKAADPPDYEALLGAVPKDNVP